MKRWKAVYEYRGNVITFDAKNYAAAEKTAKKFAVRFPSREIVSLGVVLDDAEAEADRKRAIEAWSRLHA